jgi:hypothetical protein
VSDQDNQFKVRANGGVHMVGFSSSPLLNVTQGGNGDGISIHDAGDDGVQIGTDSSYPNYGLYIPSPGVPETALRPNTANANGE